MKKAYVTVFTILSIAAGSILTLSQSGGTFVIQRSAIVASGDRVAGGIFTLDGTAGQPSGSTSSGGTFQVGGGFWGGGTEPLANISISGRIFTSDAFTGLRNATVSLTDTQGGVRSVTTSPFGFYAFDNVVPGNVYTIRVSSRRFRYQPQVVSPNGDLTGVDFVGLE